MGSANAMFRIEMKDERKVCTWFIGEKPYRAGLPCKRRTSTTRNFAKDARNVGQGKSYALAPMRFIASTSVPLVKISSIDALIFISIPSRVALFYLDQRNRETREECCGAKGNIPAKYLRETERFLARNQTGCSAQRSSVHGK